MLIKPNKKVGVYQPSTVLDFSGVMDYGPYSEACFAGAMPHLQQGANVIGKKALQTGVNVAQDVLDGDNIKTAVHKRTKQALGLPSQNSLQGQSGAGKKAIKRKAQGTKISSAPGKKAKTSPQQKKPKEKFSFWK